MLSLLMALNRFFAVFWYLRYNRIFSNSNTTFMKNFGGLVFAVIYYILYDYLGCFFYYEKSSYTFWLVDTPLCYSVSWYSDILFNNSLVVFTLAINLITVYKAGKSNRNLLQAAGAQMTKRNRQRELGFIKQSFAQGAVIFGGQCVYYVGAVFVTNSVLLFFITSLWVFVHAIQG